MKILFATTNQAKVRYYAIRLQEKGFDIVTLSDVGITQEVEETGKTPTENAIIKATSYAQQAQIPTIAIDEGLYLNGLSPEQQPGVHVRRVNGRRLNDQEMIEHYLHLVEKYGENGQLTGYFKKGIAVAAGNSMTTFENDSPRLFVNRQSEIIDEGYPLASIQIVAPVNKFKSELTREEEAITMDIEQQPIFDFLSQVLEEIRESIETVQKEKSQSD